MHFERRSGDLTVPHFVHHGVEEADRVDRSSGLVDPLGHCLDHPVGDLRVVSELTDPKASAKWVEEPRVVNPGAVKDSTISSTSGPFTAVWPASATPAR